MDMETPASAGPEKATDMTWPSLMRVAGCCEHVCRATGWDRSVPLNTILCGVLMRLTLGLSAGALIVLVGALTLPIGCARDDGSSTSNSSNGATDYTGNVKVTSHGDAGQDGPFRINLKPVGRQARDRVAVKMEVVNCSGVEQGWDREFSFFVWWDCSE